MATEDVWQKYLEKHAKAKIWKTKAFPLYNSIQILVEGIVATGDMVFRAGAVPQVANDRAVEEDVTPTDEERNSTDDDEDEISTKGNSRKRSAANMTPSNLTRNAKRQNTRSASRSGSGRSGTDAMFSVAGAIESLADRFVESPNGSSNLSTPQRRSAAINLLEEDDDLSDNEQVQAIRLFSQRTAVADSYIAIKKKTTRTRYIQSELSEF